MSQLEVKVLEVHCPACKAVIPIVLRGEKMSVHEFLTKLNAELEGVRHDCPAKVASSGAEGCQSPEAAAHG